MVNQPDDVSEYCPVEEEVRMLKPKYNAVNGDFMGLENCMTYLTVWSDDKILCDAHKMKLPSSFLAYMFDYHKLQHISGAFDETDFSKAFFSCLLLLSETKRGRSQ